MANLLKGWCDGLESYHPRRGAPAGSLEDAIGSAAMAAPETDDALKEEARDLLLLLDAGSTLKYRQSSNGCGFWFLDGASIGENGPWELVGKRLIAGGAPGSDAPLAITERGRAVATRLRGKSGGDG
jgi:hypothetical protein